MAIPPDGNQVVPGSSGGPARRLIDALRDPARYPHPATGVTLVETHISWVLLAGDYAYKIKKPVDLGFADFTTLERRKRFCHEELRLNRRLAPSVYLEVIAIRGEPERPLLDGGDAPVIEYAVKMRRFPDSALGSAMLTAGTLARAHIVELAGRMAAFHARAPEAHRSMPYGEPQAILRSALENITPILAHCAHDSERVEVQGLWHWTERHFERLRDTFIERKARGRVRECHGDLHLGNVALLDGTMSAFDGIEFNESLRWIDVMSEIAFPAMDLAAHARPDLAWLFLNEYLERTGDYEGLGVLAYYTVYRALVRAKIACLRTESREGRVPAEARRYLALAKKWSRPGRPAVVILHGLSGCGKTSASAELMQRLGAIRIRSDVERKRLAGWDARARGGAGVEAGLYGPDATQATYSRLATLAGTIVQSGYPAIVDAAFLQRAQRDRLRGLAGELHVPFGIVTLQAPVETLRARIARRLAAGADASDADAAILEHQLRTQEPLTAEERALAVPVDASRAWSETDWRALAADVAARVGLT